MLVGKPLSIELDMERKIPDSLTKLAHLDDDCFKTRAMDKSVPRKLST